MHPRRLVCFIIGFWLASYVSVFAIASMTFRSVDRLLMRPPQELERWVKSLRYDQLRLALNHFAGEINRGALELWGYVDLLIVIALILSLIFYRRTKPVMILATAILVGGLVNTFFLSPQVIGQGRLADFSPVGIETDVKMAYNRLNMLYNGVAIGRMLLGTALLGMMLIQTVRPGPGKGIYSKRRRSSRSSSGSREGRETLPNAQGTPVPNGDEED